jgi:hypothetical protein
LLWFLVWLHSLSMELLCVFVVLIGSRLSLLHLLRRSSHHRVLSG